MAFTNEDDARNRLRKDFDVIENGRPVLCPGSVVRFRSSTAEELAAFTQLAAEACLAGRIEWDDVMDGFPIFLIAGADPNFPDQDINTGLPLGAPRGPLRAFGIAIEDLQALHGGSVAA
ncbi:hypothetical protein AB6806_10945 [Bosea sp. RCC_152_1]|uniref:hypothetical protein n=1 Tax=Bosea sp. RCC_152_1 TaxID=3239228 RepID=UPI0035246EDB